MCLSVSEFSFFELYLLCLFNPELKPSGSRTFSLINFLVISFLPVFLLFLSETPMNWFS